MDSEQLRHYSEKPAKQVERKESTMILKTSKTVFENHRFDLFE
jgi:hypothetical protein